MDNLITAYYAKGKKLDAVLSPNDSLAIGIVASLKNNGYGTAKKPYPVLTGQDCDVPNVKAMIAGSSRCRCSRTRGPWRRRSWTWWTP